MRAQGANGTRRLRELFISGLLGVTLGCGRLLELDGFVFPGADAGAAPQANSSSDGLRPDEGSAGASLADAGGGSGADAGGAGGEGSGGEGPARGGSAGMSEDVGAAPGALVLGWRLPCEEVTQDGRRCVEQSGRDPCPEASVSGRFAGDPDALYAVVFRVAGVVEGSRYSGGMAVGEHLYLSGAPADFENQNYFELAVSDPPARYFLNHDAEGASGPPLLPLDYESTLTVRGGANVTLTTGGSCGLRLANCVDASSAVCEPESVESIAFEPREQALFIIQLAATPG